MTSNRRSRGKSGGPGGHSLGGRNRLRNNRSRSASSRRWLERQLNDPYVRQARLDGWRARAAYKLLDLDERFRLLRSVTRVVDLGAAPGSWSQVVLQRRPEATLVGIDLLEIEPLAGLDFLQGDFLAEGMDDVLRERLGGPADLVLSDMAANTIGHAQADHMRTMVLVEAAVDFAMRVLRPGGAFVAKVLGGGIDDALLAVLKKHFRSVKHAKPPSSRRESSESYVVAQQFRGE